jgi:hypothetical protein
MAEAKHVTLQTLILIGGLILLVIIHTVDVIVDLFRKD